MSLSAQNAGCSERETCSVGDRGRSWSTSAKDTAVVVESQQLYEIVFLYLGKSRPVPHPYNIDEFRDSTYCYL